jgi:cytochrome P450
VSDLIRARDGRDALSEGEMVGTVLLLVLAGHETTAKAITRAGIVLGRSETLHRVAAGQLSSAQVVEEVLRHQSPIDTGLFRWAKVDTDLAGVRIRAGEQIFVSLHLANLDPSARAAPDVFDPQRGDGGHVTFGHGIHLYLGAALARAELTVVVGELARRCPDLRPAVPLDELTWSVGATGCPKRGRADRHDGTAHRGRVRDHGESHQQGGDDTARFGRVARTRRRHAPGGRRRRGGAAASVAEHGDLPDREDRLRARGNVDQRGRRGLLSTHLANFDPASRADPHTFDPQRPDSGHTTFGYGLHFCLGAALARAELSAVFTALPQRLPGLGLAVELDDLAWNVGSWLNAPDTLPVTW